MNLKEKIEKAGIENCLFLVPMRPLRKFFFVSYESSLDEVIIVPAKITESRYKLKENYKITLKSIYGGFGEQHYYLMDLSSLIKSGSIEFFVKNTE